MRTRGHHVAAFCGIVALAPAGGAQDMVAVSWFSQVYALDSSTGSTSPVGSATVPGNPNAMTRGPQGQVFITYRTGPGTFDTQFATVDPETGNVTPTGPVLNVDTRGLAYRSDGRFYGVADSAYGSFDGLYRYDPATQSHSMIASTGLAGIQALESAPDGTLFAWDIGANGKGLITIDPISGAVTDVNPSIGGGGNFQFLAFHPTGLLLAGGDTLSLVDPANGAEIAIPGSLPDLRGAVFTDPPCAVVYGGACPGTGGFAPALAAASCPDAGTGGTLALELTGGPGGALAMVVLGFQQAALPLGGGCTLYVQPIVVSLLVPSGGTGPGNGFVLLAASVAPATTGVTFTAQGLFADPAPVVGFTASNGLSLTIP